MPFSIHRLRVWLLVGATLLVLVIAGFLGYARYRSHRFLAGLPARLGVDIRRETNGYTYSQSVKGKTVMTLHAAKAVEHQNGKLTLHDVGMILYGRKQDRMDRIAGSEFEYDQATGVVRALGEVHIDLEAPGHAPARGEAGNPSDPKQAAHPASGAEHDPRLIHVKTRGLVYIQKLGVAATDQDLEFSFGGMTGHATGAEYNADTGVLILQSAVEGRGVQHGVPIVLRASHAELERASQRAVLTQANYISRDQTARGDRASVHLRSDGSPERLEAEGNVVLKSLTAGTVTAPRADVLLNQAGRAQNAHLFGGVKYEDMTPLREGNGDAKEAEIAFDATGHPDKVLLTGAVHVHERTRATEAAASPWTVRDATSGKMTFAFANDSTSRRKELRSVAASERAHLTLIGNAGTPASVTNELSGEDLQGTFTGAGKLVQLSEVRGNGHTVLQSRNAQGAEQSSAGDTLEVTLRPGVQRTVLRRREGSSQAGEEIARAVQSGHVVVTSRPAARPGAPLPATTRATADLGVYDGDTDHLTLSGNAQVAEGSSLVSANRIVLDRNSGDATAEGIVKATYLQPKATAPVHVLADRAQLFHASSRAVFYGATGNGSAGKPARLWQGASQVEAPVIEMDQQKRSLNAHGSSPNTTPAPVHAVLVSGGAARLGGPARPSVVRIASQSMIYSDLTRQAEFAGEVKVEEADGVLHARQATVSLQAAPEMGSGASKKGSASDMPKSAAKEIPAGALFGGSVERIVASGKIEIDQPGRRAVGEQLVYTASDGMFALTGTSTVPPKLVDDVQGMVTGTTLRFHAGDDSVMVTGTPNNPAERVHTVTRIKQK